MAAEPGDRPAGDLPDPLVERALRYSFGLTEREWYAAERRVMGVAVLFRVLSPAEDEAAKEAAWVLDSPSAQATETQVQHLARAVVAVDGQELPPGLAWRLEHFRSMPQVDMVRVHQQFEAVTREYWALTEPDAVKN